MIWFGLSTFNVEPWREQADPYKRKKIRHGGGRPGMSKAKRRKRNKGARRSRRINRK